MINLGYVALDLTPASHGPHRYWLLFITRLGGDSQGRYYARLSDVQVLS